MGAIAIGVAWVYGPSLDGGFLWDDRSEIRDNPAIAALLPLEAAMFQGGRLPHRPLSYYSFAVSQAIHGLSPLGFRLGNLAIHLTNAWLLRRVLVLLWNRMSPSSGEQGDPAASVSGNAFATAVALLWVLHPLCTQAVAYIYQRMELLGAMAILLVLLFFLEGVRSERFRRVWWTLMVVVCAIGPLFKETAVAAPVAVVLVDWLAMRWRPRRPFCGLGVTLRGRWWLHGLLLLSWASAVGNVWLQRIAFPELTSPRWTIAEYGANQPRAIARYLRLSFWPDGQCFDYHWNTASTFSELGPGWTSVVVLIGIGLLAVHRRPWISLAIGMFLVLLGPTSSVLPVTELIAEHRMYLPLAAVIAGTCGAVIEAVDRLGCHWPWTNGLLPVAVGAAACGLACVTASRAEVYGSAVQLWADTAAKAPHNPRAFQNLGVESLNEGRWIEAAVALERAMALGSPARRDDREAWHANTLRLIGLARFRAGDPRGPAIVEQASLSRPADPLMLAALAETLERRNPERAAAVYRRLLIVDPSNADAMGNLAILLASRDPVAAEALFRQAIRTRPAPQAYANLATLLERLGRGDEAKATREHAAHLRETQFPMPRRW